MIPRPASKVSRMSPHVTKWKHVFHKTPMHTATISTNTIISDKKNTKNNNVGYLLQSPPKLDCPPLPNRPHRRPPAAASWRWLPPGGHTVVTSAHRLLARVLATSRARLRTRGSKTSKTDQNRKLGGAGRAGSFPCEPVRKDAGMRITNGKLGKCRTCDYYEPTLRLRAMWTR